MNNSFINKYKSEIWFKTSHATLSDSLIYIANTYTYICKPILWAF